MVSRRWSYYESFIFLKNRRFIINPDKVFIQELEEYYNKTKQQNGNQKFQCICGACSFSVSCSFDPKYFQNPIGCSCTFKNPSSYCPNIGCLEFLQEMKNCFKYPAHEVMWGFTFTSQLVGDFEKTQEFIPSRTFPKEYIPKQWVVYKCASCDFITHALKKISIDFHTQTAYEDSLITHFDAAVVTNIPVDHTKQLPCVNN